MRVSQRFAISTASVSLAIALWGAAAALTRQPELLPGPFGVGLAFHQMLISGELTRAVVQSLLRVVVGYCAGAAMGVISGAVLGLVPIIYACFGGIFEFLKGIPPIALVPVVIIWLGIGEASKYVVVAYIPLRTSALVVISCYE